jgi:hypothetical protein
MRRLFFVVGLALLWLVPGIESQAAGYRLEKITAAAEGVTSAVSGALQSEGYQILDESGKIWCDVWTRKEIPNLNKPASTSAKYQGLYTGVLVGIIKFPADFTDFRGQPIKAGTYTLRYAVIPQDGNHMGVSPILDFLLLIPASDDNKDPDGEMSFNDVVALSRKATGTNHPANLLMSLPPESLKEAVVEKNDLNHWVLKFKIPQRPSGEILLGIVVVGQYEG